MKKGKWYSEHMKITQLIKQITFEFEKKFFNTEILNDRDKKWVELSICAGDGSCGEDIHVTVLIFKNDGNISISSPYISQKFFDGIVSDLSDQIQNEDDNVHGPNLKKVLKALYKRTLEYDFNDIELCPHCNCPLPQSNDCSSYGKT